jgi:preprotein translocase subunit SecD
MNRYPTWLNLLVLGIVLLGSLLALPNIYGSAPAVQLSALDAQPFGDDMVERVTTYLETNAVAPKESFIEDGRVIVTFGSEDEQQKSGNSLRERFSFDANIAFSSAPELPPWIRGLGLSPMSLGLDLRGGVYVLLEVDMDSAIESRMQTYSQDFADRLREQRIRSRAEVNDQTVIVRLQNAADLDEARRTWCRGRASTALSSSYRVFRIRKNSTRS